MLVLPERAPLTLCPACRMSVTPRLPLSFTGVSMGLGKTSFSVAIRVVRACSVSLVPTFMAVLAATVPDLHPGTALKARRSTRATRRAVSYALARPAVNCRYVFSRGSFGATEAPSPPSLLYVSKVSKPQSPGSITAYRRSTPARPGMYRPKVARVSCWSDRTRASWRRRPGVRSRPSTLSTTIAHTSHTLSLLAVTAGSTIPASPLQS